MRLRGVAAPPSRPWQAVGVGSLSRNQILMGDEAAILGRWKEVVREHFSGAPMSKELVVFSANGERRHSWILRTVRTAPFPRSRSVHLACLSMSASALPNWWSKSNGASSPIASSGTTVPSLVRPDETVLAPGYAWNRLSKLRFSWTIITMCLIGPVSTRQRAWVAPRRVWVSGCRRAGTRRQRTYGDGQATASAATTLGMCASRPHLRCVSPAPQRILCDEDVEVAMRG